MLVIHFEAWTVGRPMSSLAMSPQFRVLGHFSSCIYDPHVHISDGVRNFLYIISHMYPQALHTRRHGRASALVSFPRNLRMSSMSEFNLVTLPSNYPAHP
jgi:hypothetical protein